MGKYDYRDLTHEKRRELLDILAEVVARLRKKKDARELLERLLTPSEQVMLARRLQVAELLVGGRTYEQIQRKLGVGISTIRSIDSWMEHAYRDYQDIRAKQRELARAAKKRKQIAARKHRQSTVLGTFADTRRRDSRFILMNLLLGDL